MRPRIPLQRRYTNDSDAEQLTFVQFMVSGGGVEGAGPWCWPVGATVKNGLRTAHSTCGYGTTNKMIIGEP